MCKRHDAEDARLSKSSRRMSVPRPSRHPQPPPADMLWRELEGTHKRAKAILRALILQRWLKHLSSSIREGMLKAPLSRACSISKGSCMQPSLIADEQ